MVQRPPTLHRYRFDTRIRCNHLQLPLNPYCKVPDLGNWYLHLTPTHSTTTYVRYAHSYFFFFFFNFGRRHRARKHHHHHHHGFDHATSVPHHHHADVPVPDRQASASPDPAWQDPACAGKFGRLHFRAATVIVAVHSGFLDSSIRTRCYWEEGPAGAPLARNRSNGCWTWPTRNGLPAPSPSVPSRLSASLFVLIERNANMLCFSLFAGGLRVLLGSFLCLLGRSAASSSVREGGHIPADVRAISYS